MMTWQPEGGYRQIAQFKNEAIGEENLNTDAGIQTGKKKNKAN